MLRALLQFLAQIVIGTLNIIESFSVVRLLLPEAFALSLCDLLRDAHALLVEPALKIQLQILLSLLQSLALPAKLNFLLAHAVQLSALGLDVFFKRFALLFRICHGLLSGLGTGLLDRVLRFTLRALRTRHLILQEVIHSEHFFYPNGGDKSHQLVDLFATLKCQFPERVHFLPGNHEVAQMTGRQVAKGGQSQNSLFVLGVQAAYGDAAQDICRAYYDLFRASPLAVRTPNGVVCCHTLVPAKALPTFDPMRLLDERYDDKEYAPGGAVYGILWGRDSSAEVADAFLRKMDAELVVTGHIATDDGFAVPNAKQLIVDCAHTPAAYVRFAADRPITHAELVAGVVVI